MSLARDLSNNRLLTLGTPLATTSGVEVNFTGIPSWVRRVTLLFNGVSLSGTAHILIQLASGGTFAGSTYASTSQAVSGGVTSSQVNTTAGIIIVSGGAANAISGTYTLNLHSGTTWVGSGIATYDNNLAYGTYSAFKSPALAGALDRIRIVSSNGTDTFDAGSINILYE